MKSIRPFTLLFALAVSFTLAAGDRDKQRMKDAYASCVRNCERAYRRDVTSGNPLAYEKFKLCLTKCLDD